MRSLLLPILQPYVEDYDHPVTAVKAYFANYCDTRAPAIDNIVQSGYKDPPTLIFVPKA